MIDKITLIIPTHNRHDLLIRTLDYYTKFNIKILVADSSINKFPHCNDYKINYFHYPDIPFFKKMSNIVQKVQTPYVFLSADDDFIFKSTIINCLNFLEKNPDYASVQGYYVNYLCENDRVFFYIMYRYIEDYDINAEKPEDRLKQSYSLYVQNFYSIQKTENLKEAFSLPFLDNLHLMEHAVLMVSIINGKHKVLPILYSTREIIKGSGGKITPELNYIITNPDAKEEYLIFFNSITTFLANKSKYDENEAKNYISEAINCYLNISLPYFHSLRSNFRNFLRNFLLHSMRIISPKIYNSLTTHKLFKEIKNFSIEDLKKLQKIKKMVLMYSKHKKTSKLNKLSSLINRIPSLIGGFNTSKLKKIFQSLVKD